MKRVFLILALLLCLGFTAPDWAVAGGISIDAGLTPAEGRWILRSQIRQMERESGDRTMTRTMFPAVLVYGLRPEMTVAVRQAYVHRKMSMAGNELNDSGAGDLYFFAKYKAYRLNSRTLTLGIAPLVGLELPTGARPFSSETWDLTAGLYISARSGSWASDINFAYGWNGFADENSADVDPGDNVSVDLALAYQISLNRTASVALAPVLELSWSSVGKDESQAGTLPDTGETALLMSPGLKLTVSSVIVETLVQIPVAQDQNGVQLERNETFLAGVRLMY